MIDLFLLLLIGMFVFMFVLLLPVFVVETYIRWQDLFEKKIPPWVLELKSKWSIDTEKEKDEHERNH